MELDLPHIITVLVTMTIVVVCVLVHYEGLVVLGGSMSREPFLPRVRIVTMILGQLILHVVEVWIFGFGYYVLINAGGFGSLVPVDPPLQLVDYVYYSAAVFSTLGFGDLVPVGPIRFLTGMEAMVGLTLITWSASFTFLKMQRYWGRS